MGANLTILYKLMDESVLYVKTRTRKELAILSLVGVSCYFAGHYVIKKIYRKIKKYPPGPIGLPILGSMISFGNDVDKFMEYQTYYGEISFFTLGIHNACSLNSSKVSTQVLKNDNCVDRIPIGFFSKAPITGIIPGDNNWAMRRRVLMKSFIAVLNSKYVSASVDYSFKNIIFSKIDKIIQNGGVYYPRDDQLFLAFRTIFKALTGDDAEKYPELMKDVIKGVDGWFVYFYELFGPALLPSMLPLFRITGTIQKFSEAEEGLMKCAASIIEIRKNVVKSGNYDKSIHSLIDDILECHHNGSGLV